MNGTKSKFINEIFLITTPEKRREGMEGKKFLFIEFVTKQEAVNASLFSLPWSRENNEKLCSGRMVYIA